MTHQKSILTALAILLAAGSFWWFSYRPYQARKTCAQKTLDFIQADTNVSDSSVLFFYDICLHVRGL